MIRRRIAAFAAMVVWAALPLQPAAAGRYAQDLQSAAPVQCITDGGSGALGGSYAALSGDGRYIAFESLADGLAPGHEADSWDTYVRDRTSGAFERVSVRTDGTPAYNLGEPTAAPSISADGARVAFLSPASTLVASDTNGMPDIFVHDRTLKRTVRVSINSRLQESNGPSYNPVISGSGRFVIFQSTASNLVEGDGNDAIDVFVRDLQERTTERLSVGDDGQEGSDPHEYGYSSVSISEDGRYAAFSYQELPVRGSEGLFGEIVYLRDRQAGTIRAIAQGVYPVLSAGGRYLAFVTSEAIVPDDRNSQPDVYLFDQQTGTFERISMTWDNGEAALQDIYSTPGVSADGRYVIFESNGGLTPTTHTPDGTGLSHIYLRDRQTGRTILLSRGADGAPANGDSHNPVISADGDTVAFVSTASNLVAGDANGESDVFVFDARAGLYQLDPPPIYLPLLLNRAR
jgi:Tol biopolymer transport system component